MIHYIVDNHSINKKYKLQNEIRAQRENGTQEKIRPQIARGNNSDNQ